MLNRFVLFISIVFYNFTSQANTISKILVPRLDIAADLNITKILDIDMGGMIDLNSNAPTTHTGSLTLNTSHGISKKNLTGVIHYGSSTSGKVKIRSEPGFVITLWVIQPISTGSFNNNVFWSDPKCKILRSDDATASQEETSCGIGNNLTVLTNDASSYIYVGGKLNLSASHDAHTGDGGIAIANESNFLGNHILHVAYN